MREGEDESPCLISRNGSSAVLLCQEDSPRTRPTEKSAVFRMLLLLHDSWSLSPASHQNASVFRITGSKTYTRSPGTRLTFCQEEGLVLSILHNALNEIPYTGSTLKML